jgi:hypothetical protein
LKKGLGEKQNQQASCPPPPPHLRVSPPPQFTHKRKDNSPATPLINPAHDMAINWKLQPFILLLSLVMTW